MNIITSHANMNEHTNYYHMKNDHVVLKLIAYHCVVNSDI